VTPTVLVLGPVVNQQQDRRGRQALDETVEQGLGLGVNPMQVFEDQQEGLHLGFAQQHPLQRGKGALPSLWWIEPQEGAVGGQRVQ
jgi:hypothetical protein